LHFTQVAEPAATAVSCASNYTNCACGSVEGFESTECTFHKDFLCPFCSASESRRFSHRSWGRMGLLVDRSLVPFPAAADARNSCLFSFFYVMMFYGSSSATSKGNELTRAQAKNSCTYRGCTGQMHTDNQLTLLCNAASCYTLTSSSSSSAGVAFV
jgi:hypothetical protein